MTRTNTDRAAADVLHVVRLLDERSGPDRGILAPDDPPAAAVRVFQHLVTKVTPNRMPIEFQRLAVHPAVRPALRLEASVLSLAFALALGLAGCAIEPGKTTPSGQGASMARSGHETARWQALADASGRALVDRLSWGANASSLNELTASGRSNWLDSLLKPPAKDRLPPTVEQKIAGLSRLQVPLDQSIFAFEHERRAADSLGDPTQSAAARRAYQSALNEMGQEAASRFVLRALYSADPLREQLTWFWMNHFNVFAGKANLRAMVGDYEERAIRPHVLGRFRDLLGAATRHPAMLRYLDNAQNAVRRSNENHARELLERHTLGAEGGYTQADVQSLARVMTGWGVANGPETPRVRPARVGEYRRLGLTEYNPDRHDDSPKTLLGQTLRRPGAAELDEALDLLALHPATAHFIAQRLALFLVGDDPPAALVERAARQFSASQGDLAATVAVLIDSPEFARSLGHQFKDPMHYVLGAVRLACDDRLVTDTGPVLGWIRRLGQGPNARQTPDGWPLDASAWSGPGQMVARFEVARAIAGSTARLCPTPLKPETNGRIDEALAPPLSEATRKVLGEARSSLEWNMLLLASPEMMLR